MTIIRAKRKRHNFAIIDVLGLQDSNLSMSATGLLSLLLTKPDDWEVDIKNLARAKTDGRTAVTRALRELESAGYITIKKFRNSRGLFSTEYIVFETLADRAEWLKANPQEASSVTKQTEEVKPAKQGNRIRFSDADYPRRKNRNGKPASDIYKDLLITDLPINQDPPVCPPVKPASSTPDKERHTERCAGQEEEKGQEEESSQSSSALAKSSEETFLTTDGQSRGQILPAAGQATSAATRRQKQADYQKAISGRPERPPRQRAKFGYPEGPWLHDNGTIRMDFFEDIAKTWLTGDTPAAKSFGAMQFEDVVGCVASRYLKPENHAELDVKWQTFVLKTTRREVHQTLLVEQGINLTHAEERRLVAQMDVVQQHTEAYATYADTPAELPLEVQKTLAAIESTFSAPQPVLEGKIETPAAQLPPADEDTRQQLARTYENSPAPATGMDIGRPGWSEPKPEEFTKPPQAFLDKVKELEQAAKAKRQAKLTPGGIDPSVMPWEAALEEATPPTPEEQENINRLAQLQKAARGNKQPAKSPVEVEYEHLKRALSNPITAQHQVTIDKLLDAHACGRLVVKFERGVPVDVSLPGEVEEVEPTQEDGLPF